MSNINNDSEKLTSIGQLNGTLGSVSTVKRGSVMISDLINDIEPIGF